MNKAFSIILILSSVFMLSCHRDPEPNVIDHEFTDVKAVPQFTTCDISCQNLSVQQRENVHARVLYSLHEDLKEVETIPMEEDDSCLTCQVTGLAEGTLYYYTFEAYTSVEAYRAKETYHFTTQVSSGISVTTGEVTDITQTTAKGRGMVNAAEGVMVTERGLCWGTGHNPTTQGTHLSNGYGTGEFFVELDELSPNTKYYVRAYAISATGTEYGTEVSFTTNSADLPEVVTGQVTGITATTAVGHGQVTSEGTSPVTERGVCWSTGHDPLVSDSHSNAGTGMGNFSVTLSGLTPNATYYLRAYATNEHGTAYGAEVSFKALEGQPEVETVSVTDITASSAIGHGKVTAQGGSAITARGFCWSTEHNPTTESSHIAAGEGMGEFDATIEGLAANTRYYLRAYATNGQGTTYGSELEFTTAATKPTVTTGSVEGTLAHGEVTDDGGSAVTERGICWSTGHEPTTEGLHANNGTGTGSFSIELTGLEPGKTYYIRAYATNNVGTSYGNEVSFSTSATLPTVTTAEVGNITQTTARGGGNVTSDGGANVTERGICWSTNHSPTASGSHATSGTGTGSFTANMTGLTANTTYYVRAYAKNSQGTSYGSEVSFTTSQNISAPTVTTSQVTNITQTTATGGGNVTADGGAAVTERGICWSTSHSPTASGSHATSGTGTGSFTANITGLTANTTYYVRAYAKNSQGTAYGSEVSFTTSQNISAPTVTTSQVTNVTQTTATGGGNVTADGGAAVTERGICWSTSHNPTTSGTHGNSGSGTGPFTVQMAGLSANTTYYVRAYAINSQGTSYGNEVSFTTSQNVTMPTVTTAQVTNIQQTTATGGGNVTADGGAAVTVRGVCWSTSHNPTVSGSHTTDGTGTGNFTSNMAGLTANTTYYVRAYATNSAGTAYGSEVSFTTLQSISLPTVTTANITNVTQTTATGGGNVTSDGNATVTARGVCWSTSHNPTVSGNHTTDGTGTGGFISNLTDLTANTTYYVRAYATNSIGTAYGNEIGFTTISPPQVPIGAISGLFTVNSNGDKVYFSKGNLQYQASTNTWRFAENQWDYVGLDNGNISSSYSGWIDLFGWGTSGYDHGAVCYQPWSTSQNYSYYYVYGNENYNLYDQTGKADWGYNRINNGGNIEHQWRVLKGNSYGEWDYVFNRRSTTSGIRYVMAVVNGVNGIILVPDNWSTSTYVLNNVNPHNYDSFNSNIISEITWMTILEPAGCVFLPSAGERIGNSVNSVGGNVFYWTSSHYIGNEIGAYCLIFSNNGYVATNGESRNSGLSVRLVQDYNP